MVEEWTPDNTYYISGDLNVYGKITILPGTVVKLAPGASINVLGYGARVVARGQPYDYILFTNADDDTCGEIVEEADPGRYNIALNVSKTTSYSQSVVQYCKFGHGTVGVQMYQPLSEAIANNIVRDMTYGGIFIYGSSTHCRNNLIVGSYGAWAGIYLGAPSGYCDITNNTVDSWYEGLSCYDTYGVAAKYNVFTRNTRGIYSNNPHVYHSYNGFWDYSTKTVGGTYYGGDVDLGNYPQNNPYDTCPMGDLFLNLYYPGGLSFRDAGDIGASEVGLGSSEFTVWKPMEALSSIPNNTTWFKLANDTGPVDLGYHHNRVDWLLDDIDTAVTNAALTIPPGAVVAIHGDERCIRVESLGRLICCGDLFTGERPLISSARPVSMHIQSALQYASVSQCGLPYQGQIGFEMSPTCAFTSRVTGTLFRGLYIGVYSYKRTLDPLSDNVFLTCGLGVGVQGQSMPDVRNNLFYFNYRAVQVYCESGQGYCMIQNNTIDRCSYGIHVAGLSGLWVGIYDNLITSTFSAITASGFTWAGVISHNALWDDTHIYPAWMDDPDLFVEVSDLVYLTSDPYEVSEDPYGRWYLDQSSEAVSAASQAACTSGLSPYTTSTDGRYDELRADIGFHYPNPDGPDNPSSTCPTVAMASPSPYAVLSGDHLVEVEADDTLGETAGIARIQLYADYHLLGQLSEARPGMTWQTFEHTNGPHTLQAVAVDFDGEVGASEPVAVTTDNIVHLFRTNRDDLENFEGGQGPVAFEALVHPIAPWSVTVVDAQGSDVRHLGSGCSSALCGLWYGEDDQQSAVPGGLYSIKVATSSPEQSCSKVCCVNGVPWDECMLLVLAPIADKQYDKQLVEPVIDCARVRLIPYRVHYGTCANWYWLSKILTSDACRYFYISAHGSNNYPPDCQTTSFWIGKNAEIGVFSDLSRFAYVEEEWGTAYSLASLGLAGSTKMKFVWVDACHCGCPDPCDPDNNDMAKAFGIWTEHWTPDYDQCYLSFDAVIPAPTEWPFGLMDMEYTKLFWEDLAYGYYVDQAYDRMVSLLDRQWLGYMTGHTTMYITPNAVVLPLHP